jgi:hypothetical protein
VGGVGGTLWAPSASGEQAGLEGGFNRSLGVDARLTRKREVALDRPEAKHRQFRAPFKPWRS